MDKDNNTGRSRRSVLKSLGGAASFSSIAGVASATGESVTGHEKRQILSKDEVNRIYEEVGHPNILAAKKIQSEVIDTTGIVYRFYTKFGELRYISYGETNVAQFIFGTIGGDRIHPGKKPKPIRSKSGKEETFSSKDLLENPSQAKGRELKRKHIPEEIYAKYEEAFEVPGSIYSDSDSDIAYIRETTPEESSKLTSVTGVESGKEVYSSEKAGYVIIKSDESDSRDMTLVKSRSHSDTHVSSAIKQDSISQLEIQQTENIAIQESCDAGACWACLNGGITWTATCGAVCFALSWSGPVAIAACVGCAITLGIPVGYFCWKCHDTCA